MNTKAQTGYKKFTAKINTPTLLDDFVPTYIEDIASRFEVIENLAKRYSSSMHNHAEALQISYTGFESVANALNDSVTYLDDVFSDFKSRMKYFTLVFFGAVSAGKTSMICDLANTNPIELTTIIAGQPGFDSSRDGVSIGPNVATINLYEFLIEKSCVRLVDVPGIGGVVHDNETLAPFVNMADCIVFLLNAANDITKDDQDFLYDHVAAIQRNTAHANGSLPVQQGLDKKILVVLNKWKSVYQHLPPAHAQKDLERKTKWILYGDDKKTFSGIAEYFSKSPEIVCANTRFRDSDTGEPYEQSEHLTDLHEVVDALRKILEDEGAEIRLNRPRQILEKEFGAIISKLNEEKTNRSLEDLATELDALGLKLEQTTGQMKGLVSDRLNRLELSIATYLRPRLKSAINSWKPKVGILRGLQGAVPEWVPFAKDMGLGRTAMQDALQEAWEEELRQLITERVNTTEFTAMIMKEIAPFSNTVMIGFQLDLLKNPRILAKVSSLNLDTGHNTEAVEEDDILASVGKELEDAVNEIQTGIMDDIINIVSWDAILMILAGVVLSPAASLLVALWRRWRRGEQKGHEAKQEIDSAIDNVVADVAAQVKERVSRRLHIGIQDIQKAIKKVLNDESLEISEPHKRIDQIIIEIEAFRSEVFNASA